MHGNEKFSSEKKIYLFFLNKGSSIVVAKTQSGIFLLLLFYLCSCNCSQITDGPSHFTERNILTPLKI